MSEGDATLTEPIIVPGVFCTGLAVEIADDYVRIVGWEQLPDFGGEMKERRIVIRVAMPKATAHQLLALLRRGLGRRYEH